MSDTEGLFLTRWLHEQINARLMLAKDARGSGVSPAWEESSSGVLNTGDPWPDSIWACGNSALVRIIAANDLQDTVARCEAELAILDEHYILTREDRNENYEEFSVIDYGGANKGFGCITCHYYSQGRSREPGTARRSGI